jgi:hypothetical protein
MLPNLLIIGAGKSGTTSLHSYLAAHPEVSMSETKELRLFVRDDWRERLDWYAAQFGSAKVRGESSPGYTMYPYRASVAERIHEVAPEARLIYVVRDPVERAIANYIEWVSQGYENRPIDHALTDTADPANPHLCGSQYATQLHRYLNQFSLSQILVLDQWSLLNERQVTLRAVFEFLGIDPDFESPAFSEKANTRRDKVAYNRLGVWLIHRNLLTERSGQFKRRPLIRPVRALLSKPIKTRLGEEARATVVAALRPEVEALRELTGQAFPHWPSFPTDDPLAQT